jgi:Ca2+/Na+ antiporter
MNKSLPKGWLGIKLKGPRWEKTRYCAVCRKNVPGLDHHCSWLQTCVGQSNYAQFFTIAVCGAIQFSIQLIFCSICIIWVQLPFEETETIRSIVIVLLAVCVLISVPCTIMYFVLLCFHISLYFHGYGTYEWMLRRRRKKRAAAAAMAAPSAKETPPKTDSLSIANIQTVGQVTSI